ncbi:MAG TPA: glutamine synthetase family protein [Acidimicrobiales bacterium]|nr:glutamine synthetase family protein [Acidimicrobiales bacterium]
MTGDATPGRAGPANPGGDEGMLSLHDLREAVATDAVDTVVVGFTDHYGRLVGKRYDAGMFVDEVASHGTHGCDYLLTTDMEMEPVPGYEFANWQLGYGDVHLVPDLATLRRADWLDRTALVLCDVAGIRDHEPTAVAPRTVLRRQVDAAADQGLAAMAATELEYYLYRTPYREAAAGGYADLDAAGWYLEDYHLLQGARTEDVTATVRRHLRRSGVPVESSKGEWGVGQHELNVRYADVLCMADRHVVFKQCLKETADRLGASVTFMAKVATDQAGSSCHVHMSLWRDGVNAFAGDEELGPVRCSPAFRTFLGGVLDHVPDVMVFLAPTVNSYKRYVDGSWAPTRLAWSYDNRTAGVRVVGEGPSLRLECRIPGADCNPYLALAALLAAGLDGIAQDREPPACFDGDVYAAADLPRVPRTLADATDLFVASPFAEQAFGRAVVDHYAHFFRTEWDAYLAAVSDWERRRYFERI